ncbi:sulfite exporter TauE/SafE family protein [Kytococcus sp. Marseille-QA3725]
MTLTNALVVVGAGILAGGLTSTVGVASLVSFPTLLALGLPPVTANMTNAVGLVPSGLGSGLGFREEIRRHPRLNLLVLGLTGVAGIIGAALLLALPPGVFEAVTPWLILFTCALVAVQPRLSAWLKRRRQEQGVDRHRTRLSPVGVVLTLLIGLYGGYFGAGAGVMMLALLALSLDLELKDLNATRSLSMLASKLTAAAVFMVVADIDWAVAGLLAAGSLVGGYLGARIARRLPDAVLRVAVVLGGTVAAVNMMAT